MKTIKTLFAILFLMTMFLACETESADDQIGLEVVDNEQSSTEDDTQQVQPGN